MTTPHIERPTARPRIEHQSVRLHTGRLRALGRVLATTLAAGCGGASSNAPKSPSSGDREARTQFSAPDWFHQPPKSATSLFFVGDATGQSDEASARDLAIQKAMGELTSYCGATVKSDFSSTEREANGKHEYVVSMTVDIAGDELTVREAVARKTLVGRGNDGRYDAYALIEWPRSQYEDALRTQKNRAARALEQFLEAEAAVRERDVVVGKRRLREAQSIMGPMRATIPLDHPKIRNTSLLFDAMKTLDEQLSSFEKERKDVMAVAVMCERDGASTPCRPQEVGAMREAVSHTGFRVSAEEIDRAVAKKILDSENPKAEASTRAAGYVLAVQFSANHLSTEGPFTFIRCGARGVLYDTTTERIVAVNEVEPAKAGHPKPEAAYEKGCSEAGNKLAKWVGSALKQHLKTGKTEEAHR